MKSDEHIGKPVRECPGYETSYTAEYEVDGEKCAITMHAFEDGSRQFHFKRGELMQGIALSGAGIQAVQELLAMAEEATE